MSVVDNAREATAQFDRGRELAAFLESGADSGSICL
jgi:hypothetical protein